MSEEPAVKSDVADGFATITLNRPDTMNAWNQRFGEDLLAALERARDDDAVRAVMITGAGRGFSSGADLTEQREPDEDGRPDLSSRLRELYHPILITIREMPKPIVAAVNGPAAGIGCSLALCCDLVVAAESSFFLLAFVNIGLVPDGGSTATVPARIGGARAMEMALLGERVPADRALEWGLVNRVVPDDDFPAAARTLVAFLAKGPTRAYANAKQLLNRRIYPDFEAQLEAEADAQREQGYTADFVEGVIAFAEKRSPNFTGM
jgi:2-(1,2-epoxy-1,2-dihydrophenyl)acetyl-CoA isomerase